MEINNCDSTKTSLSFYDYFNELNSSGDKSYFADAYRAIGPLNDEEVKALKEFQQKLSNYNSSKVFEHISNALWKNVPFVYVPEDEIHLDLIEELMKDDFDLTIDPMGVYIVFTNRSDQVYNKGRSRIMNMLDRAFTTRTMLSGIFHRIVDSIIRRVGLMLYGKLEFDMKSYYVNPLIISNIVSEVTNLHTYVFNETLVIDIDKDIQTEHDEYPALFSSISNYSVLTEEYFDDIMREATERKRNKTIMLPNPFVRNAMFYEFQQNGFYCEKQLNDVIFVDWTNAGEGDIWSFAYKCWVRFNTVSYYRVCASAVTRALNKSRNYTTVIFPDPKNQIDEDFFIKYFNERQSQRCYPIEVNTSREHKFTVRIKTEDSEGVKS